MQISIMLQQELLKLTCGTLKIKDSLGINATFHFVTRERSLPAHNFISASNNAPRMRSESTFLFALYGRGEKMQHPAVVSCMQRQIIV